jgi:hypothetical protein
MSFSLLLIEQAVLHSLQLGNKSCIIIQGQVGSQSNLSTSTTIIGSRVSSNLCLMSSYGAMGATVLVYAYLVEEGQEKGHIQVTTATALGTYLGLLLSSVLL